MILALFRLSPPHAVTVRPPVPIKGYVVNLKFLKSLLGLLGPCDYPQIFHPAPFVIHFGRPVPPVWPSLRCWHPPIRIHILRPGKSWPFEFRTFWSRVRFHRRFPSSVSSGPACAKLATWSKEQTVPTKGRHPSKYTELKDYEMYKYPNSNSNKEVEDYNVQGKTIFHSTEEHPSHHYMVMRKSTKLVIPSIFSTYLFPMLRSFVLNVWI